MHSHKLLAYLDGNLVGSFAEQSGQITFKYEPDATLPISLSMPLNGKQHKNKAANAFLWGLLPDNQQALNAMANEAGTSPNSVFGLLRHHGKDVAGALQLLSPNEVPSDASKTSINHEKNRLSDDELEVLLRKTLSRYHGQAQQGELNDFKFSVAGAQPKIALTADHEDRFLPPSKKFATTHIIKPNDPRSHYYIKDMDTLEVMCLDAAYRLGINSTEAYKWFAPSGDMSATVTVRYDRTIASDGVVKRLHQEDFCQALSVMPDKKYQHQFGGPGLSNMRTLIDQNVPASKNRERILTDLFTAIVFNVGIVGTDAHAKNYSLMLSPTHIELAPLYDSITAAAHLSADSKAYFPMKIGSAYDMREITIPGLVTAGMKMGIPEDKSFEIVSTILSGIPNAIQESAAELGETKLGGLVLDGIERFSPVRLLD